MLRRYLGFVPHDFKENRRYFWSVDSAYGLFTQNNSVRTLRVVSGALMLSQLETDRPAVSTSLNGNPLAFRQEVCTIIFPPVHLQANDEIQLS